MPEPSSKNSSYADVSEMFRRLKLLDRGPLNFAVSAKPSSSVVCRLPITSRIDMVAAVSRSTTSSRLPESAWSTP